MIIQHICQKFSIISFRKDNDTDTISLRSILQSVVKEKKLSKLNNPKSLSFHSRRFSPQPPQAQPCGTSLSGFIEREARIKEALELNEALGSITEIGGDEAV